MKEAFPTRIDALGIKNYYDKKGKKKGKTFGFTVSQFGTIRCLSVPIRPHNGCLNIL